MLANLYKEHQQNQSETRRQAGASALRLPHRRSAIAAPPSPAPPSGLLIAAVRFCAQRTGGRRCSGPSPP